MTTSPFRGTSQIWRLYRILFRKMNCKDKEQRLLKSFQTFHPWQCVFCPVPSQHWGEQIHRDIVFGERKKGECYRVELPFSMNPPGNTKNCLHLWSTLDSRSSSLHYLSSVKLICNSDSSYQRAWRGGSRRGRWVWLPTQVSVIQLQSLHGPSVGGCVMSWEASEAAKRRHLAMWPRKKPAIDRN